MNIEAKKFVDEYRTITEEIKKICEKRACTFDIIKMRMRNKNMLNRCLLNRRRGGCRSKHSKGSRVGSSVNSVFQCYSIQNPKYYSTIPNVPTKPFLLKQRIFKENSPIILDMFSETGTFVNEGHIENYGLDTIEVELEYYNKTYRNLSYDFPFTLKPCQLFDIKTKIIYGGVGANFISRIIPNSSANKWISKIALKVIGDKFAEIGISAQCNGLYSQESPKVSINPEIKPKDPKEELKISLKIKIDEINVTVRRSEDNKDVLMDIPDCLYRLFKEYYINDLVDDTFIDNIDKDFEKLKKLVALTKSDNQNESDVSKTKAIELCNDMINDLKKAI